MTDNVFENMAIRYDTEDRKALADASEQMVHVARAKIENEGLEHVDAIELNLTQE